ncbi:MAG: 2-oxoacid:acceptor oxidoreductase family protein [Syntrophales bacterium]|nr:2-oxoacid:acceptor oxidoreductase family protein [Syntrophales bacterium]
MITKTIFAGFGGQGVLMMGYTFAQAAMMEGYHVTYLPSYGAEVRGGAANCTVAVGDEEIASPIASEPEYLVIMNKPSLLTFQNRVTHGGVIFLNTSLADIKPTRKDVTVHEIPLAEIAETIGVPRGQNLIMLGAFVRKTSLVSPQSCLKSIEERMKGKRGAAWESNRRAFMAGYEWGQSK